VSLIGDRRKCSSTWWAVFLCACLAMGVYLAFDVLDLDGSNLRDLDPGTAMAADTASAEAGRFLPQSFSALGNQDFTAPRVDRRLAGEFSPLVRRAALESTAARAGWFRPRAHLHREVSSTPSRNADPA
jgi:hypothetical protein